MGGLLSDPHNFARACALFREFSAREERSGVVRAELKCPVDVRDSFLRASREIDPRAAHSLQQEEVLGDGRAALCSADCLLLQAFTHFHNTELARYRARLADIDARIVYERFLRDWECAVACAHFGIHRRSTVFTRVHSDAIRDLEEQRAALALETPESFFVLHAAQWLGEVERVSSGVFAQTPSVSAALERIATSLARGDAVLLRGHLGTGKTELAVLAAERFALHKLITEDVRCALNEWCTAATGGSCAEIRGSERGVSDALQNSQEARTQFQRLFSQRAAYYEQALRLGDERLLQRIKPLFISGSKHIDTEDLFLEKTLVLKNSLEGKTPEHCYQDVHAFTERGYAFDPMLDIYLAKYGNFGTEVQKIEREVLRAVKEGRPLVIDEINAIPMQHLIALNDILQKRVGDFAYIPGVGPVKIAAGFGVIATGNISSGLVHYEGTGALNPAFASRFNTFEYDYPPQSTEGLYTNQAHPEKNELFRIILARLASSGGSLCLPDIDGSLDKLFKLAQLAKVTQQVFSGKWKDSTGGSETHDGLGDVEPELREAVLSIRNVIRVLDEWNRGEEKDVDQALWDGFIGGVLNADDQNYILSQAVRFGFFQEKDGWSVRPKGIGAGFTSYEEIRTRPYEYTRLPDGVKTLAEVVVLLFGHGPTYAMHTQNTVPDVVDAGAMLVLHDRIHELVRVCAAFRLLQEKSYARECADRIAHLQCSCDQLVSEHARLRSEGGTPRALWDDLARAEQTSDALIQELLPEFRHCFPDICGDECTYSDVFFEFGKSITAAIPLAEDSVLIAGGTDDIRLLYRVHDQWLVAESTHKSVKTDWRICALISMGDGEVVVVTEGGETIVLSIQERSKKAERRRVSFEVVARVEGVYERVLCVEKVNAHRVVVGDETGALFILEKSAHGYEYRGPILGLGGGIRVVRALNTAQLVVFSGFSGTRLLHNEEYSDAMYGFENPYTEAVVLSEDRVVVFGDDGESRVLRHEHGMAAGDYAYGEWITGFKSVVLCALALSSRMVLVFGRGGEARLLSFDATGTAQYSRSFGNTTGAVVSAFLLQSEHPSVFNVFIAAENGTCRLLTVHEFCEPSMFKERLSKIVAPPLHDNE